MGTTIGEISTAMSSVIGTISNEVAITDGASTRHKEVEARFRFVSDPRG